MQVAHKIQSTKSALKYAYFCANNIINQRNNMNFNGATPIFSAITTTSDFKIVTEFIRKRKMTGFYAWMNDLDSSSSFTRKLLIKWYIEQEIDLSDIGLD